jgi:hypothetical protein
MNELVKSFFSFTGAMSLLGFEQLNTLMSSEQAGHRREQLNSRFDAVTGATREQLGERGQRLFDAGDSLQRELMDMACDVVRRDDAKPKGMFDRAADLAEKAAESLREAGQKKTSDGEVAAEVQPA